jgi:hypothetical protein
MTEDLFERAREAFFGTGKTLPGSDKSTSLSVAPSHEKPVTEKPATEKPVIENFVCRELVVGTPAIPLPRPEQEPL